MEYDYRDSRPIYEQIKDDFRKLIVSGAMECDEKLPSVRALATKMSINPNTIQRAYNELENEGYIYSIPGKGSFVAAIVKHSEARINELKDVIKEAVSELIYLGTSAETIQSFITEVTGK